ncbi:MAG: HIT domain-containing protein [Rhodospirillaceae bacterium]|nr:HIT domain-containing protein [Rhodospirillales bacterium]
MFDLHERLVADTVHIIDWPLCSILLMNDSTYPWVVLVPRRHGVVEIHELDKDDRETLMEEIAEASQRLQNTTKAHKINVAALGNVVPQLHVHVIGRFATDAAWPRPVWGVVPAQPFAPAALMAEVARMAQVFAIPASPTPAS